MRCGRPLEKEDSAWRSDNHNASRHFAGNDRLTVNTLEAIYGQENSFGILLGTRGSSGAAGHFQFRAKTTREYGLHVSKDNDQRFDIGYVASAAARYLKDADAGIC